MEGGSLPLVPASTTALRGGLRRLPLPPLLGLHPKPRRNSAQWHINCMRQLASNTWLLFRFECLAHRDCELIRARRVFHTAQVSFELFFYLSDGHPVNKLGNRL